MPVKGGRLWVWERKRMDSHSAKRNTVLPAHFTPLTFQAMIRSCYLKRLSLWQFVAAVIENRYRGINESPLTLRVRNSTTKHPSYFPQV